MFCFKQLIYRKSCKFQFTYVCLRIKIYRIKKESKGRLLGSIQRPLSYQAYALTTVMPM